MAESPGGRNREPEQALSWRKRANRDVAKHIQWAEKKKVARKRRRGGSRAPTVDLSRENSPGAALRDQCIEMVPSGRRASP